MSEIQEVKDMIKKAAEDAERERLRDTFAAAALTGLCANPEFWTSHTTGDTASEAYQFADAMLKIRGLAAHAAELYKALEHLVNAEEGGEASPNYYRARKDARALLATLAKDREAK